MCLLTNKVDLEAQEVEQSEADALGAELDAATFRTSSVTAEGARCGAVAAAGKRRSRGPPQASTTRFRGWPRTCCGGTKTKVSASWGASPRRGGVEPADVWLRGADPGVVPLDAAGAPLNSKSGSSVRLQSPKHGSKKEGKGCAC